MGKIDEKIKICYQLNSFFLFSSKLERKKSIGFERIFWKILLEHTYFKRYEIQKNRENDVKEDLLMS